MKHKNTIRQKNCVFCGQFFQPGKHVGNRQKSCTRAECQKKRRQTQQRKWREANPGYFKGRYEYLKEWRKDNPDYQKRWRARKSGNTPTEIQTLVPPVNSSKSAVSSMKSIRLNLPSNMRTKPTIGEIQTLVLTLNNSGGALWLTEARMHHGSEP